MMNLKERVYHLIAEHDQELACLYKKQYHPTPYIVSDLNPRKSIESQSQFWLALFHHIDHSSITDKAQVFNVLMNSSMKLDVDTWLTGFEQHVLPVILVQMKSQ